MQERKLVKSSNLRFVTYDPGTRILEVEFASGSQYRHFDVPPELYDGLIKAESAGRFYSQNLANKFGYAKVATA